MLGTEPKHDFNKSKQNIESEKKMVNLLDFGVDQNAVHRG